jgi:hypothetical protein
MRFRRNPALLIACTLALVTILLPVGAGASFTANPTVSSDPNITRPLVFMSGQDVGQVYVVDTGAGHPYKTFDFAHGCTIVAPATACTSETGMPTIQGVGGPTPGDTFASPKPHLITFSPDARFAYVTFQNTNPGKVAVIDTVTLKVVSVITINEAVPSTAPLKVTEAQQSALDPSVMLVGLIGFPNPGFIVKVNVNEATETWTVGTSAVAPIATTMTTGEGPACIQFSPSDTHLAYYDSSLAPNLGVGVIDPTTMTFGAFTATTGDVQCGFHEPVTLGGSTKIVVTDSGTPFGASPTGNGDVYSLDPTVATGFLSSPSVISAQNLHDNWPVQLEPDGAPTTFSASTVFGSDRDNNFLDTIVDTGSGASLAHQLPMTPFMTDIPSGGRGAIDTLDGSGDTVFAAMKETGDLAIIDDPGGAGQAVSFIHLANPDVSCSTVGNANFHKCFVVHALRVQPLESSTTTLTTSASSTRFGGAVTFTAKVVSTVTNPDIKPAGTVTFSMNGQTLDVAPVVNGKAVFTTTGLIPGTDTVTATYNPSNQSLPGDTPIFATSATSRNVFVATSTVTGSQGSVVVGAGQSVLISNANIAGSVTVNSGGAVDIENSTIHGSVTATGASAVRMCGSTVTGAVSVTGSKGFVLIGDNSSPDNCAGNTLDSSVTLLNNTHGIVVLDNFIGGVLTASGNSGAGPFPQFQPGPEIQ